MTCRHDLWSNDFRNDITSSKTNGLKITNMTCLANNVSSYVPHLGSALDTNFQVDPDNECLGIDGFSD